MSDIDKRLDRLAERHEALAGTVELLTSDIQALKSIAEASLDSIKRLERIALSHEVRIEDIDERLARLEKR